MAREKSPRGVAPPAPAIVVPFPSPHHDPTDEQWRKLVMDTLENDTEGAPWMVMGDLQFWSASSLAHSLRNYARQHTLPWFVASMMPIRFTWGTSPRRRQLAPDVFVAFVPDHPR